MNIRKSKRATLLTRGWSLLLVLMLTASALLLPSQLARGQAGEKVLTPAERAAMTAIADIVSSQDDMTGGLLREIGYEPPVDEASWIEWPAIRKVEAAFHAAEHAEPGSGERLLTQLTNRLADEYEAVRYDPSLENWWRPDVDDEILRFTPGYVDPADIALPGNIKQAIGRITRYSDAGALGGPQGILRYFFELAPDDVYEILRTSPSNQTALELGLSRSPIPPSQLQRLRNLVLDIQLEYEGARVDQSLTDILSEAELEASPFIDEDGIELNRNITKRSYIDGEGLTVVDEAPGSLIRTRPELPASATRYADFASEAAREAVETAVREAGESITSEAAQEVVENAVRTAGGSITSEAAQELIESAVRASALSADVMVGVAGEVVVQAAVQAPFHLLAAIPGGWGGVVFGNTVTDQTLPPVESVLWIPDQTPAQDEHLAAGVLEFTFADGSQRLVAPVLEEDVYAAHSIAYGSTEEGIPPLEDGQGVGLVSLDNIREHYELTENGLRENGRRAELILHPALVDLDLGWSIAFVDWFPSAISDLVNTVARNSSDETQVQEIRNWHELGRQEGVVTWKVIDAPLTVVSDGHFLDVSRAPEQGDGYPAELLDEAYIEMIGFSTFGDEPVTEWSRSFYSLVPTLTRSMYDYQRVNSFAKVLALVRWAKHDGAQFAGAPARPEAPATPGSLIILPSDELVAAPGTEQAVLLRSLSSQTVSLLEDAAANMPAEYQDAHEQIVETYARVTEEFDSDAGDTNDTLLAEYQRTQAEYDVQNQIYLDAEIGSLEEAQAQEQMEVLEQESDALLADIFPSYFEFQELHSDLEVNLDVSESSLLEDTEAWLTAEAAGPEFLDAYQAIQSEYEDLTQSVHSLGTEYQQAQADYDAQSRIYLDADVGSTEEAEAQEQMAALEREMDSLLAEAFPAFREYQQIQAQYEAYLSADVGSSREAEAQDQMEVLREEMDFLLAEAFPEFGEYRRIEEQYDAQFEEYLDADVGSSEEAEAQEQMEALEQAMEASVAEAFPSYSEYRKLQTELGVKLNIPESDNFDDIRVWLAMKLLDDATTAATWETYQQIQAEHEAIEQKRNALITESFPELAEYEQIQAEYDAHFQAFLEAEYGSFEEVEAQEQMEALESQRDAIAYEVFPLLRWQRLRGDLADLTNKEFEEHKQALRATSERSALTGAALPDDASSAAADNVDTSATAPTSSTNRSLEGEGDYGRSYAAWGIVLILAALPVVLWVVVRRRSRRNSPEPQDF